MNRTLKYISIQHELGMSIGLALRLRPMLTRFSKVCLRRLSLASVHFYFLHDHAAPVLESVETASSLRHFLSVPQNTPPPLPVSVAIPADGGVRCQYQSANDASGHYYSFNLCGFGTVTLHRIHAELESPIIELLKPLFERLGLSCQASIEHEELLQAVAARQQAEQANLFQLMHDDLTQLPNRRQLMRALEAALTSASQSQTFGALLFLDLDRFKTVNDTLGHAVGDLLLIAVAGMLRDLVGVGGMVSRLSGDEFVILLGDLAPRQVRLRIDALLERIRMTFSGSIQVGEHLLHMTPSIGIELFPDGDCGADQILRRADTAMYQAKLAGPHSTVYYDRQLSAELEHRRELERELRGALKDTGQFELRYQSQYDQARCCIGAEALIRWNHPTRTDLCPNEFIAVAEETGLMLELGGWVLRQACQDIRQIQSQSLSSSFKKISVNVSALQFNQSDFVETLMAAISESGIDSSLLALELTESAFLRNTEAASAKMTALRLHGIDVAIDDFGTGYSSLSYLSRLPVVTIKIDQAFVNRIDSDPGNQAIVETIIALGRALDMELIAEGVETEAEQQTLATLGCHRYQGYLYGHAVPLGSLIEELSAS